MDVPKSTDASYTPQGSGEEHSAEMRKLIPGITDSGNLKYKLGEPGSHNIETVAPTGLKGD